MHGYLQLVKKNGGRDGDLKERERWFSMEAA